MKVCSSCISGCVRGVAVVGLIVVLFMAFVGVFSDADVGFVCKVVVRLAAVMDGVCVGFCVVCVVDEECVCMVCVALSVVRVGLECVVCEKCVDFCVVWVDLSLVFGGCVG